MSKLKKQYVLGFLLICLLGVGLLLGGIIRYTSQNNPNLIETQGYITEVQRRNGENGYEYRPFSVKYYVESEDKWYSTSVLTWFSYPMHEGDTLHVWYEKDNPKNTKVSNASKEETAYILMGVGGILAVAGLALTCKYVCDVKRGKNPTA